MLAYGAYGLTTAVFSALQFGVHLGKPNLLWSLIRSGFLITLEHYLLDIHVRVLSLVFESHDIQQRFISFREDSGERSLLECRCGSERSISSAFYDSIVNPCSELLGGLLTTSDILNRLRSISRTLLYQSLISTWRHLIINNTSGTSRNRLPFWNRAPV